MSDTRAAGPDEATARALADAAGLGRAWAEHRAEVEEVVAGLAALRAGFRRPTDPTAEPAPPYAAPGRDGRR
jgi:hypothetical protein